VAGPGEEQRRQRQRRARLVDPLPVVDDAAVIGKLLYELQLVFGGRSAAEGVHSRQDGGRTARPHALPRRQRSQRRLVAQADLQASVFRARIQQRRGQPQQDCYHYDPCRTRVPLPPPLDCHPQGESKRELGP
jgi:hypothetical protein